MLFDVKHIDVDNSDINTSSRFKEWDKFIRIPLLKLTSLDIMEGFNKNNFIDDETIAKGDLLEFLYNVFKHSTFQTKDILKLSRGDALGFDTLPTDFDGLSFKDTLIEAFSEKSIISTKTLGRYILGMKDFILRGYQLIREDGGSAAKWKVIKIKKEKKC